MVECRTPEREVRGSRPTSAVLCPWARHFTPRKYWLITQEAMAPSRHDWKIVDWDVKPQHNQPFGFEGRMWDLIVSVPDHCLYFYFKQSVIDIIQFAPRFMWKIILLLPCIIIKVSTRSDTINCQSSRTPSWTLKQCYQLWMWQNWSFWYLALHLGFYMHLMVSN